jgi:hypothetical protein
MGNTSDALWRNFLTGFVLLALSQAVSAESEYAAAWGPSVGTVAPLMDANDQDGKPQNLGSLNGTNGLLFVFNRSVDW